MKKIDEKYFKDWNYKKHAKLCYRRRTVLQSVKRRMIS